MSDARPQRYPILTGAREFFRIRINHPRGVLIRWSQARHMILSNNAVYCPGSTAIDAVGLSGAVVRSNFMEGQLRGATFDRTRFFAGGMMAEAFVAPEKNDFWPRSDSVLVGRADDKFAPERDFNHVIRNAPADIGACESNGEAENPGWRIQPGFKDHR